MRRNNARSYLPVDLTDPQIARVILVVTNMGARRVDADEPDDQVRAFRLVLDQSAPSEPAEEEAAQEEEPAEEEQAAQEEEAVPSAP